ncbi:MAG: polyprenyl synthetase family protein [candidate division NC10 bacterium]|nr:polyprenyl synthetase family protein [candidate division NC10 bacterium]MBI2455192.1 polyprenyl synthetase family protein [candidate division NC10 bacterium]MBI2562206.1 polyprenyl synthetase family protein [candidate division NC10 bacterium]MBI3121134.1 polyprenyl synthetase family protein [candidate division NC10 bacterium]
MITSRTHDGPFSVIAAELTAVLDRLQEPVPEIGTLLSRVASYALASGGKRIRPALLLLAARACGADQRERAVTLASVAEMMHAATLIHDDIVDHSAMRRGRPSATVLWGSDVSVLVGDYLYSRAIQILVADGDMRILRAFADATVCMTEGEVLQLQLLRDLKISEADYLRIVTGKTAALMSAAARAGALVADAAGPTVEALAVFGLNLGIGFQLVDDALDYTACEERLGKPVGSDFREGKITYPLIHLMRTASVVDRAALEGLASQDHVGDDDLALLRRLVERYEAVPATMRLVDEYLARARAQLTVVPGSPASRALHRLVDFVRERDW